jgi:two-component system, NtrC family, response regulator HydG
MTNNLSILVVDDDVDNAQSLGELFELEGHRVSVVHSGQAAIDSYLSTNFDLAFMDVMMPGKNGVESFIEIRRMKPQAKVFMMTGYSVEELLQQAAREGALGVIEKPLEAREVLRMTERVGAGGLLVAAPDEVQSGLGVAIHQTLSSHGRSSRLIQNRDAIERDVAADQVLVLDMQSPLIDAVSCYTSLRERAAVPTTIIIPPSKRAESRNTTSFWDVGITGILNKPFDPLSLINRLPQLAA